MPVEVLVRARDPNKGYPITSRPAGSSWGAMEGLPNYVKISVDADVSQYVGPWMQTVTISPTKSYEIVNENKQPHYILSEATVDEAARGGGTKTMTLEDFVAALRDLKV